MLGGRRTQGSRRRVCQVSRPHDSRRHPTVLDQRDVEQIACERDRVQVRDLGVADHLVISRRPLRSEPARPARARRGRRGRISAILGVFEALAWTWRHILPIYLPGKWSRAARRRFLRFMRGRVVSTEMLVDYV